MFEDSMTPSELYESHLKRYRLRLSVLKQSQLPISKLKTLLEKTWSKYTTVKHSELT